MTNELTKNEIDDEYTQPARTYAPRVDIVESDDAIIIQADMPGIHENSVDITLEKNVLTIAGHVETTHPEHHTAIYTEYEAANYHRSFTLSNIVDRDNIVASVKDGVLNLTLPKAPEAQPRKIAVQAA